MSQDPLEILPEMEVGEPSLFAIILEDNNGNRWGSIIGVNMVRIKDPVQTDQGGL